MNTDAFVQDLRTEIKVRLDSEEGMYLDRNSTGTEYLNLVLRSIDGLGFKLVQDFARIVVAWNALNEKITPDDVNPGQVIQALQSEGWTVIPPNL
jgi:hypothetical protein